MLTFIAFQMRVIMKKLRKAGGYSVSKSHYLAAKNVIRIDTQVCIHDRNAAIKVASYGKG